MTTYAEKNKTREEFDFLISTNENIDLTSPELVEMALKIELELAMLG